MSAWLAVGQATTSATLDVVDSLGVEVANFRRNLRGVMWGCGTVDGRSWAYLQHLRVCPADLGRIVSRFRIASIVWSGREARVRALPSRKTAC